MFRTFGIARTVDDSNVVESYLISRDAVRELQAAAPLREIYSRPGADVFSRFPRLWGVFSRFPRFWTHDSFEQLYWYYLDRVKVVPDTDTGITTLEVQAFRADDAQRMHDNCSSRPRASSTS